MNVFFLVILGQKYFTFSARFKSGKICFRNTRQSSPFIPVVLTKGEGRGSFPPCPGPPHRGHLPISGNTFRCHNSGSMWGLLVSSSG